MRIPYLRHKLVSSKVFQVGTINAVFWMGMALSETVWAVYLNSMLNNVSAVAIVSGMFTLMGIITLVAAPRILAGMKDTQVYMASLLGMAFSYLVFALTNNLLLFLVVAMILTIFGKFRRLTLGIIFRDASKEKELDKNEGMFYTLSNVGYLFGPLVAGYFSEVMNVQSVFVLVAVFVLITLIRFRQLGVRDTAHHTPDRSLIKNLRLFMKNSNLVKAYMAKGGVEVWWVISYVFIPLLLINNGYTMGWVGLTIFSMTLPMILLEYPAMKRVREIGYSTYFFSGFLALALVTAAVFFFQDPIQLVALTFIGGGRYLDC